MEDTQHGHLLSGDSTSRIVTPSQPTSITSPFLSSNPLLSSTSMSIPSSTPAPPTLWSPANAIRHAAEPSQGYGRLRHLDRMKREQHVLASHEPLVMKWDMQDLSRIIEALESCSKGPQKQKKAWQDKRDESASRFDPRAPHFDVVLIDLTNASEDQCSDSTRSDNDDINLEGSREPELPWKEKDWGDEPQYGPGKYNARGNRVRKDINNLSMESLAGRPGWLFLWVGSTENMPEGRRILGKFGFRKVECIGWMKTTNDTWDEAEINEEEYLSAESTGNGVLRRGLEWCLVGVKGTAKRTYDSHLIHCNVNTDVIVCDGLCPPKSSLLSRIIENFSMGQRRLHLFAKPGDERPGWLCVGKDFKETTFDCRKYMRFWEERGKHGWLMPFDPEIEYFRPKTPPLQVRKRERTNAGLNTATKPPQGSINNRGKWEDDPPKFMHLGQRKRPVMRYTCPEDDARNYNKVLSPISGNKGVDPASESTQFTSQSVPKIRLSHQNAHTTQLRSASDPKPGTQGMYFHPPTNAGNPSPSGLSQKALRSSPAPTETPSQRSSSITPSNAGDYYFLANRRISIKSDISSSGSDSPTMPYQQYLLQPTKHIRPRIQSPHVSSAGSQKGGRDILNSPHPHQSMSISGSPQFPPPFELGPKESNRVNHPFKGHGGIKAHNPALAFSIPTPVPIVNYQHSSLPGSYGSLSSRDTTSNAHPMSQNIRRRSMPGDEFFKLPGNMQLDVTQNGRRSVSNGDFSTPAHAIPGIQYQSPQYLQVPGQSVPPPIIHMGPVNHIVVTRQSVVYPGYGQQQDYQRQQQQQPIQMPQQQIQMQQMQMQQNIRMQHHQQMPSAYPINQLFPQQIQHQGHQLQPHPQFGPYNPNIFQH